jgi:hypothetical protein
MARKPEKVRLRCSLRFSSIPGAFPSVVGWPFAWMEITAQSLTFSTGLLLPFSRARWSVRRDAITKIERTQHGVRLYTEEPPDPWVVASLATGRFLRHLAGLGIRPEGPVRPSTWTAT